VVRDRRWCTNSVGPSRSDLFAGKTEFAHPHGRQWRMDLRTRQGDSYVDGGRGGVSFARMVPSFAPG
jgi:hypothetical protein